MRLVPLGSGSSGNATLLEFSKTRLLVDAGLSARALSTRLAEVGVEPDAIDCILLSHEHQDHSRGAERFSRKHGTPVACTPEALDAMDLSPVHLSEWRPLGASASLDLGSVCVHSFPVPHDAARPVGFVIEGDGMRVGYATDLGHATTLVREQLAGCDVLMVESNHDEEMLRDGPYPWHLKQRVSGRLGHLSNNEAAALIRQVATPDCRAVVLGHLSAKNNTHALARQTVARALQASGAKRVEMRVAAARGPTPPLVV